MPEQPPRLVFVFPDGPPSSGRLPSAGRRRDGGAARPMRVALLAGAALALLGCALSPPPPLPAGIAELQLPRDSRTLTRIAADEDATGSLARRREILAEIARQLLAARPPDAQVPELFDFLAAIAPRMEAGAISPAWGSYLYTTHQQNLARDRPTGVPRPSRAEVDRMVDHYVEFYRLKTGRKPRTVEDAAFEDMQDWRNERRIGR
jgi:hypothetical protein